jgi:predicted HicB family RNase H-like nuclease
MPKEPRSERLTLRMTASLKKAVENLADRDNRSVSDWICLRLAEVVKAEVVKAEMALKTKK